MKRYTCDNCNKKGIGWVGRNFAGRILPVTCKYCNAKYYVKQNQIYMWLMSLVDSILGVLIIFLTIIFKNILILLIYLFISFGLFYVIHKNASLKRIKNKGVK